MLQRCVLFAICLSLFSCPAVLYGQERGFFRGEQVTILYEEPWKDAAQEAAKAYPIAKRDVEDKLGWAASLRCPAREPDRDRSIQNERQTFHHRGDLET